MTNLYLPLPTVLEARLSALVDKLGQPTTALALELIEDGLKRRERKLCREKLSAFALECAGTDWDLDPALEAAGLESLLLETRCPKLARLRGSSCAPVAAL